MGSGSRAGWYSYDGIDNGGRHSTDRILRRLQDVSRRNDVPAAAWHQRRPDRGASSSERPIWCSRGDPIDRVQPRITWAFVLEPRRPAQTRLIARARATYITPGEAVPFWMAWPFVHFGHFLMQRKQLLGIADRAERVASPGTCPLQRDAA